MRRGIYDQKKREKEKIIIHRRMKMMFMMKTNNDHVDISLLLVDFEYSSTRKEKKFDYLQMRKSCRETYLNLYTRSVHFC